MTGFALRIASMDPANKRKYDDEKGLHKALLPDVIATPDSAPAAA
jgi:hypothetical protein